jgi:phage repressor protein C with HTH and peptisase S24 domain
MKNIGNLTTGETAVIFGKITGLKTGKAWIKRTPISEGYIEDESGKIKVISDNKEFDSYELDAKSDNIEILWQILWISRIVM